MADNISNDLKKYTSLQIANYVDEQTKGLFVTRPMTILLKRGIENICIEAFGEKYSRSIRSESPKILRACLNNTQLGVRGKVMKFLDSTGRVKRADIISEILSDITLQRQGTDYTRVNDLKLSWAERIKTDSESQNKIGVKT